ncbi:hypothetical protein PGTUg99_026441 [Puccinia graminis f. sp. tritici]|uniref:Uncharacterized protein n=1 Tax=Puccinia graminis f. sp. tritici TaxID=56615 RepID=A0A5B0QRR9_PUCGR|nr:hypothetical protein PGTUg99_026441 [Puccinia graminis f. sp. tritici]
MPIISEVTALVDELASLRTQLEILETRTTTILSSHVQLPSHKLATTKEKPVEGKETISHVAVKLPKKSSSRTKGNSQTIRSRSFKVMRHLINIIDVSQAASIDIEPEKKRTARNSLSDPIASVSPATKLKTSTKPKPTPTLPLKPPAVPSNSPNKSHLSATSLRPTTNFRKPVELKLMKESVTLSSNLKKTPDTSSCNPIASVSPLTKSKASAKPKTTTSFLLKESTVPLTSRQDSRVSSISLQPRTDLQPQVEPKSMKAPLTPPRNPKNVPSTSSATPRRLHPKRPCQVQLSNDLPTEDKGENCNNSQATAEISTVTRTPGNIVPEVFAYDNLQLRCGRFSLLKHDPAMLDLLPISVKEKRFIKTSTVTDIENLQQASEILVQRQVLGIWEWKAGTSRATLHEYKTPELGTTISNRRFKFVGFAWKGALGQQPPRIEELHEDISQGADTLRWYWFKDLWLLFYFD